MFTAHLKPSIDQIVKLTFLNMTKSLTFLITFVMWTNKCGVLQQEAAVVTFAWLHFRTHSFLTGKDGLMEEITAVVTADFPAYR